MPKCGELPRHPLRVGGIVPFLCQPVGYADASSAEGEDGERNQTENRNRKNVLAASGRGTTEEGRMPVSTNRAKFTRRQRRCSDPDEEDPCEEHHKRNYRVHHDAELAMVGIAGDRVYVHHLGYHQERQQDYAHHSCHSQSAGLWAAIAAQMWPNSCQRKILIRTCQELLLRRCSLQIEFNATVPFDAL